MTFGYLIPLYPLVNKGVNADFSFMGKICFFCGSNRVIKKGLKNGKQRWFCKACERLFSSSSRISTDQVIGLCSQGNFTVRQIAVNLNVDERTVYRHLAKCHSCSGKKRPESF